MVKASEFDFKLPKKSIAQSPIHPKDHSRLMVVNRQKQTIVHDRFYNLSRYLSSDHFLIFNDTKVFPARLFGYKQSGARVEIFLTSFRNDLSCLAKTRPGLKPQQVVHFTPDVWATVESITKEGQRRIRFDSTHSNFDLNAFIDKHGQLPTPPYIKKPITAPQDYQTIYAKNRGAIAAPTAGFHFTKDTFKSLKSAQIAWDFLTLHVGLGTFEKLPETDLSDVSLHEETFYLSAKLARKIKVVRSTQRQITAVGTTTLRALESAAMLNPLELQTGWQTTQLFIKPGYSFKMADQLITNFHLPRSSLFMLVCAYSGKSLMEKAYQEAIRMGYRFYSFGDAMLIQ